MLKKETVFIEILTGEIRILCWKRGVLGRKSVLDFCVLPLEDRDQTSDAKILEEVLAQYRRKRFGNKKVDAYLLLPLQAGLIREFKLPWIAEKNRDEAVEYYLDHEISVPAEELVYYYEVLEEKKNEYLRLKVSAARKETISRYRFCLIQAGYNLQGIDYAVNTIVKLIALKGDKRTLLLQTIQGKNYIQANNHKQINKHMQTNNNMPDTSQPSLTGDKIQLIMFKGSSLETMREIDIGEHDIAKHLFPLRLSDPGAPIVKVLTDETVEAKRVISYLAEKGLLERNSKANDMISILNTEFFPDIDKVMLGAERTDAIFSLRKPGSPDKYAIPNLKAYAALGCLLKIKNENKNDLLTPFLLPSRIRALTATGGLCLTVLLLFMWLCWYPLQSDYHNTLLSMNQLQRSLAELENEQESGLLAEWRKLEEKSYQDIVHLQKTLNYLETGVTLHRLNYRQGTLRLWAESRDNSSISRLTTRLIADGWGDPVLESYKYDRQSIVFSLSVKR